MSKQTVHAYFPYLPQPHFFIFILLALRQNVFMGRDALCPWLTILVWHQGNPGSEIIIQIKIQSGKIQTLGFLQSSEFKHEKEKC